MAASLVRAERTDGVARLEMDSPANRNALSEQMLLELERELLEAARDPGIRVIVLGHRGPAFCSGADLREQVRRARGGAGPTGIGGLVPVLRAILDSPKPVVARVGGPARAGGLGMVAACDIAIASQSASFATGEVRIGLAPAVLSVVALPKVGRAQAARLFLTGVAIGAEEARAIGLVAEAVPDAELEKTVERVVGQLLLAHPMALAQTKRILARPPEADRDAAFDEMAGLSAELFSSPQATEGMSAFLERRRPSWAPTEEGS